MSGSQARPNNSKNGADLLLKYLALEGADKLFGIPGAAIKQLMNELDDPQNETLFEFVICRHETGAAYIAHGYSLVKDTVGVVLTTTGPGATNALTGAANAQSNGVAMLVITGEVDQRAGGNALYLGPSPREGAARAFSP